MPGKYCKNAYSEKNVTFQQTFLLIHFKFLGILTFPTPRYKIKNNQFLYFM